MKHKKALHPVIVPTCDNFRKNQCQRDEKDCWFDVFPSLPKSHYSEKMGFREVLGNTYPPDQLKTVLNMVLNSSQENGKHGKEVKTSDELIEERKVTKNMNKNNKVPDRFVQTLDLPVLCNINPRSVYNKIDEFNEFVKEEEVDVVFLSESWEREYLPLDEIVNLEDHTVISNVNQSKGKGGRPAIIANKKKYQIQNLTNTLIQIPWGVEAVWCILTPKNVKHDSKIQKIACCTLYCKPNSNRKTLLLDH